MCSNKFCGRIKVNVNVNNLEFNFRQIRNVLPKSVKLMCVVKADAYGLGAVKVARLFESLGADAFAVATLEEAISLRNRGITKNILVLGYTSPKKAEDLHKFNVTQTVFSSNYAKQLAKNAK